MRINTRMRKSITHRLVGNARAFSSCFYNIHALVCSDTSHVCLALSGISDFCQIRQCFAVTATALLFYSSRRESHACFCFACVQIATRSFAVRLLLKVKISRTGPERRKRAQTFAPLSSSLSSTAAATTTIERTKHHTAHSTVQQHVG